MTQSASERMALMGEVLGAISSQGYVYDLSKGFSMWPILPPPGGTRINCQAAANLAKRLAEEKLGLEGKHLKVVSTKPKGGFIVPAASGRKALGTTAPDVVTLALSCWEFDNHFRVQDPKGLNKVYDPIFGTSGNHNPTGISASSETKLERIQGAFCQITEYGEKYRITRGIGIKSTVEVLKQGPVAANYVISDANFK